MDHSILSSSQSPSASSSGSIPTVSFFKQAEKLYKSKSELSMSSSSSGRASKRARREKDSSFLSSSTGPIRAADLHAADWESVDVPKIMCAFPNLINVDFEDEALARHPQFPIRQLPMETVPNVSTKISPHCTVWVIDHPDYDGFFLLRNALSPAEQRQWVMRSLRDLPEPSLAVTNLSSLHGHHIEGYWKSHIDGHAAAPSSPASCSHCAKRGPAWNLLPELRWATLGFHYDWTRRVYPPNLSSPFPQDLGDLSKRFVEALSPAHPSVSVPFLPQAAIVNYYFGDSTLGGHQDDAEKYFGAPVVSVSLGCACVFLLGGKSKDAREPAAILLRSGDAMLMGGNSRLAVHGVPRIFSRSLPKHLWPNEAFVSVASSEPESSTKQFDYDSTYLPFGEYIATNHMRINLNIRQVTEFDSEKE